MLSRSLLVLLFLHCVLLRCSLAVSQDDLQTPRSLDPAVKIQLFAEQPDLVTPTGIAVDSQGRVLVIESHTHFRPKDYQGPAADRIRLLEDTDGDGKCDKATTFFEGTTFTMNLAIYHDESVFVATRNKIIRLYDRDGDGRADEEQPIVHLDTKGNYPHNGLSGFAFDFRGDVYFGFGENLGEPYTLNGSGDSKIAGTEGGCIFRCRPDGSQLEKIAVGFWNPFHVCFDDYGRLYAVDNDPDWRPPCRLLHIVEGGDYGYRYSLGRRGTHPFTAWFGELPGTLGMVAGTGEAPCAVLSYQSDNLPQEYNGRLITSSWGIHALEFFDLEEELATIHSKAQALIKGDTDFRPVGIALAPNGSLFVSDWVKRSYELHGHGRVWQVFSKDARNVARPRDPQLAFASAHRPTSQFAARELAKTDAGVDFLSQQIRDNDQPRLRAGALAALVAAGTLDKDTATHVWKNETSRDVRVFAAQAIPKQFIDLIAALNASEEDAEVQANLLRRVNGEVELPVLMKFLESPDAFVQQAARRAISQSLTANQLCAIELPKNPRQRLGVALLLLEVGDNPRAQARISELLDDSDPDVRFVAVRWVGKYQVKEYVGRLREELKTKSLTGRLFDSYLAAIDLIEKQRRGAEYEIQQAAIMAELLDAETTPPPTRILALRKLQNIIQRDLVAGNHPALALERLSKLVSQTDDSVALEAIRTMGRIADANKFKTLIAIAENTEYSDTLRVEAVLQLSAENEQSRAALVQLATNKEPVVQQAALRTLVDAELTESERALLTQQAEQHAELAPLVRRVIDKNWRPARPKFKSSEDWLDWLADAKHGDPQAGERLFFNERLTRCASCHVIDGRGGFVAPDLSHFGQAGQNRILESIVDPSREIAPRYLPWTISTYDGKTHSGILITERGDEQVYADNQGKLFKIRFDDIEDRLAQAKSIMPDGLLDRLTDQEIIDLLAYLLTIHADSPAQ